MALNAGSASACPEQPASTGAELVKLSKRSAKRTGGLSAHRLPSMGSTPITWCGRLARDADWHCHACFYLKCQRGCAGGLRASRTPSTGSVAGITEAQLHVAPSEDVEDVDSTAAASTAGTAEVRPAWPQPLCLVEEESLQPAMGRGAQPPLIAVQLSAMTSQHCLVLAGPYTPGSRDTTLAAAFGN